MDERRVSEVARLAGVTVRTLHHYDEIGLLSPQGRTEAGYRLYGAADLARLQQILFYRRLGIDLAEIGRIIDDPGFDRVEALRRLRVEMTGEAARVGALLDTLDRTIDAAERGVAMTAEEMLEVFGEFDPADHEAEAQARWPDAFAESTRRTSQYTREDWQRQGERWQALVEALATSKRGGAAPDSEEAMDLAEQHRLHISKWFYDCSHEVHRGLGQMYVADERFTAHWDDVEPGLAAYAAAAFQANAERVDT